MNQTTRDFLESSGNRLSSVSQCLDILSEYCYQHNQSLSGAILAMANVIRSESETMLKASVSKGEIQE